MIKGILDEKIGSSKDNMSSPIHNWYKFTAGFSYKFVDVILEDFKGQDIIVYEPFAGCGTTLVESQKLGFHSVGNESQELMCSIIRAKLNWTITKGQYNHGINIIENYLRNDKCTIETGVKFHPLLKTLYDESSLRELYCIRDGIKLISNVSIRDFFNLALSQTLHKAAIHPIAVPYISRTKFVVDSGHAWDKFYHISKMMINDLQKMPHHEQLAKVYNCDSRQKNDVVLDDSCGLCITSPPYLNNLDCGEVSKVHSLFFEMTSNWNDITKKVRKKLVTGATTHYTDSTFLGKSFQKRNLHRIIQKL
jgi:hypothetical protein